MKDPGEIHTQNAARKLVLFSGMRYCKTGSGSPTDIDGCCEFNNKLFIYFDAKKKGKELEAGQELCFVRTVDRLRKSGAVAYLIVAEHYRAEHYNVMGDILAANCIVSKVYHNGQWFSPPEQVGLNAYIESLIAKHGLHRYLYTPPPVQKRPEVPRIKNWEDTLFT
jgi:hypothetical protein